MSRKHYCYIVIGTEFKEKLEEERSLASLTVEDLGLLQSVAAQ